MKFGNEGNSMTESSNNMSARRSYNAMFYSNIKLMFQNDLSASQMSSPNEPSSLNSSAHDFNARQFGKNSLRGLKL